MSLDNKGVIFLEYLLGITIISILLIGFFSMIFTLNKNYLNYFKANSLENQGDFAIDYIYKDIVASDYIYSTEDLDFKKYKENLGFLLIKEEKSQLKTIYNYSLYYIDGRNLIKVTYRDKEYFKIKESKFDGYNNLAQNVKKANSSLDEISGLIKLDIHLNDKNMDKKFSKIIYLENGIENNE